MIKTIIEIYVLKKSYWKCFSEPPSPPIYFRATQVGPDFAVLEWKKPHSDGGSKITNYILSEMGGASSDVKTKLKTVSAYEHSCHLRDLKQNLSYYFCIQAENKAGLSPYCNAEYAVTPMRPLGKTFAICL